jgi:TetR/AcrR family transcriptional repressor of nem operon
MVRYDKSHKQATREHILRTAARRFRQDGIDGVGLASLMAEAGLTHGGFYNHFASREELVAEAAASALDETLARIKRQDDDDGGIEWFVRTYLNPQHRDAMARGCGIAALAGEMARRPAEARQGFWLGVERLEAEIGARLPPDLGATERRDRAGAVLALMLGTLQLARLTTDPDRAEAILQAGIDAALALARNG